MYLFTFPLPAMARCQVYVLQLENGKKYVGKVNSNDPAAVDRRLEEHRRAGGAAWTSRHRPICVLERYPNSRPEDEDFHTRRLMSEHGQENVRGGSYTMVDDDELSDELNAPPAERREREARGAGDLCLLCGRDSHWARDCFATTERLVADEPACLRCGHDSHTEADCYAKTSFYGRPLSRISNRSGSRSRSPRRRDNDEEKSSSSSSSSSISYYSSDE